jgi:glycosyltransferase involved in cell wall biosynthesis
MNIDLVVPSIGRSSLSRLLQSLERAGGAEHRGRVIIVDDRRVRDVPLPIEGIGPSLRNRVTVLEGKAAGPASARNIGWRASDAEWIAFVDDDVVVGDDWFAALRADLSDLEPGVAASQARVAVPMNSERPSDWERNVAGLARSRWITADMAYRRDVLERVGGFDERFKRAYREDSDLALRVCSAGYDIARGRRRTDHPVGPADWWVSVRLQAGNADDAFMDAKHGRDWRARAGAPRGRFVRHAATVACAGVAIAAAGAWLGLTAEFALARIAPGPKTPREIGTMLATSAVIPFAAVYHRVRGLARHGTAAA